MKQTMLLIQDAAAKLHVSRQTIYTYVSRGLLHAEPDPHNPKRSLYKLSDVERLIERRERGRSHARIAASTLSGGEPVLTSRLSTIEDGKLYYRGHDVVALADRASLEDVAMLLWDSHPSAISWAASEAVPMPDVPVMERILRTVSALTMYGPWTGRIESAHAAAAILVTAIVGAISPTSHSAPPIHERLGRALSSHADAPDLVRRCLVLSADHELNPSTYAARVVASTHAPLGACLLAGLAALSGPLHGGVTNLVCKMMREAAELSRPDAIIALYRARGERVPGFGQRLYPDGDPRAAAILAHVALPGHWDSIRAAMEQQFGLRPNVDFALAAVEHVMDMPSGSGFGMFAAGRAVGWIAHALEQWACNQIIRPRAAYTRS